MKMKSWRDCSAKDKATNRKQSRRTTAEYVCHPPAGSAGPEEKSVIHVHGGIVGGHQSADQYGGDGAGVWTDVWQGSSG